MMIGTQAVPGLAVALGIGLLVGIERERRRNTGDPSWAGVRTFVLVALGGGLSALLGPVGLAVAGAFTTLAVLAAWGRVASRDTGMTTGFAMLVVFLCGALAQHDPVLAAGSGVVVAVVLATKSRLHEFVRHGLTEQELHDLLLLAAAATIVLPMLPDRAVDPWGALNPRRLWLLAVVVMGVNGAGYVALRSLGARWGLLLAGLAGGFASSTATTAAMGALARRDPGLAWPAACCGAVVEPEHRGPVRAGHRSAGANVAAAPGGAACGHRPDDTGLHRVRCLAIARRRVGRAVADAGPRL